MNQKRTFIFPTAREATNAKLILWFLCEFVDWIFVVCLKEAKIEKSSVLGSKDPPKQPDFKNRVRNLFVAYKDASAKVGSEEDQETYVAFIQATKKLLDEGETVAKIVNSRFQAATKGHLPMENAEALAREEITQYIESVKALRGRVSHRRIV